MCTSFEPSSGVSMWFQSKSPIFPLLLTDIGQCGLEESTASFLCFAFHKWRGKKSPILEHLGACPRGPCKCVWLLSPASHPASQVQDSAHAHALESGEVTVTQLDELVSHHTVMPLRTRAVPVGYSPGSSENQNCVNWVFLLPTLSLWDLRRVTLLLWA